MKGYKSWCFHGGAVEGSVILGYDASSPGKWFTNFRRNRVPSSSEFYRFKNKCWEPITHDAATYRVRSKSSRTKAIKSKKRRRVFFSVCLLKIASIRCNTQFSTCFQLLHGVRKFFCRNLVYLVGHSFLNLVSNLAPFSCTFNFGNRK